MAGNIGGVAGIQVSPQPVVGNSVNTGATTITATSANALAVGQNGTTNAAFNVDTSTASSTTGLNVKSAASGGGLALTTLSGQAAENLTLDAKGTGTITLNGTATGQVHVGNGLTVDAVGLTVTAGGATITAGGLTVSASGASITGGITLTDAASQIIPGATSFAIRDNSNANNNLLVSNAGALTVRAGITHGSATLLATSVALTNNAAAQTATLTNAPTAGNPSKWVPVNDNGTTRNVPMW